MSDLATTNMWLGILAVTSVVEFLVVVVMAVMSVVLYLRAKALIDRAESAYVAPMAAKINLVADEAREVVRSVQQVEERVRGMVDQVEDVAGRVGSVAQHVWPVLGTWRAVSAAVSSLRTGPRPRRVA